jgi:hypothetical protein
MWRSTHNDLSMQRFLQAERHIRATSKRMKKCHDFWVVPSFASSSVGPDFAFGKGIRFGLQIDFGVDIGGVQQNGSVALRGNIVQFRRPRDA